MRKLYEYLENFGRMGTLSGRMLLTDEEHAGLLGKSIWVGDELGKHSEVEVTFSNETVRLVTDNQEFLAMAEKLGVSLHSGFDIAGRIKEEGE